MTERLVFKCHFDTEGNKFSCCFRNWTLPNSVRSHYVCLVHLNSTFSFPLPIFWGIVSFINNCHSFTWLFLQHFDTEKETLQSFAICVYCQATSLYNDLRNRIQTNARVQTHEYSYRKDKKFRACMLSSVWYCVQAIKNMLSWLDRYVQAIRIIQTELYS